MVTMENRVKSSIFGFLLFLILGTTTSVSAAKSVYYPHAFQTVEALKDWSSTRMYESNNFVVFWGPRVGTDPLNPPDSVAKYNLAFNPANICNYLENSYAKFITEIKFCSDDPSTNLGKYKIVVIINDTWIGDGAPTGWAFGGGYEGVIGAMWVHPGAVKDGLVISHEFAHTLQMMINIQENKTGGGFINNDIAGFFWECHANYMRCQEYPIMAEDDMPRWLATRMQHWSSTRHHYGSYHTLFTIQELYGIEMVNRLWRESNTNEHPLTTLSRLKGWNQAGLNDFMYNNVKREVIFDWNVNNYGTIMRARRDNFRNNEPNFLWREYTMLDRIDSVKNRYIVPDDWAPQDYGVNIIPLHSTCDENSTVKVKFKGHEDANSNTGWRYGFVAESSNGTTARYSDIYSAVEGEVQFTSNAGEKLYLVVMGAPKVHQSYKWEVGYSKVNRFPYEVAFENCVPEGYQNSYRADIRSKFAGHVHPNGGGWVDNSSSVASSVYVGKNAIVIDGSKISGNVRIEDNAWVQRYTVSGNAVISGNARAIGDLWGAVSNSNISDDAVVTGNVVLQHGSDISGSAVVKGNAIAWGSNYGGTAIVGGDAEVVSCSTGVYLQFPHPNNGRADKDGRGVNDPSNIDINNSISSFGSLYIDTPIGCGEFTSVVENSSLVELGEKEIIVYPNPVVQTVGTLHVNTLNTKCDRVDIVASCGKLLLSEEVEEPHFEISLASLHVKKGVNFIVLYSDNKVIAVKKFYVSNN